MPLDTDATPSRVTPPEVSTHPVNTYYQTDFLLSMDRGTKISITLTIIFAAIPAIGTFYLPRLSALASWLPFDFIFTWAGRFAVLTLGFTLGWYLRGDAETTDAERIKSIEGCILNDDIAWKGEAALSRGEIVDKGLDYTRICPKCQTPMKKESHEIPRSQRRAKPSYGNSSTTRKVWECPSNGCGHTAKREAGQHDEAERLFERHIGRIVESSGEEYSLQNIIDRIREEDKEVTPRRIWEEYAVIVDDEQVSTACFH